jgi:hypothetical protein
MSQLIQTTSEISLANRWDHILARSGYQRGGHRVEPGLYKLGSPGPDASVFVTANYTLSFDALRQALNGRRAFILVLDTRGINVWCAAGKGTFGTEELISKVRSSSLHKVVSHRNLILPQLGATGVSAHKVREECGFKVEYGPVRAEDLPDYLKTHQATAEMRRVRFNLLDRMLLVPIEVVHTFLPFVLLGGLSFIVGGWFYLLWALSAWLAATVLFFMILPCIPVKDFSAKGLVLGTFIALPFAAYQFSRFGNTPAHNLMRVLSMGLVTTALVAYITLNTTGSTPLTSWTGVQREIFRYIPILAVMAGTGILLMILQLFGLGG